MSRIISRSVADVVEQLELDGDIIVTVNRLASIIDTLDLETDPRRLGYELQRDGWLGTLRTRHAWEFLPGSRGGAYGSGDRFIEFLAQKAVDPTWPGVLAMESAASVLGLAQRVPHQEVVALPEHEPFPKALTGDWRHVRIQIPADGMTEVDSLTTWNREGLLVGIATRPASYKDTAGLVQWLVSSGARFDDTVILGLLAGAKSAVRQRAAYLLLTAGNPSAAFRITDAYPPRGTAWLGPRRAGGRYEPTTRVNDTLLDSYLQIGIGA